MTGTSLSSLCRPLWRLIEQYDISPDTLFHEAGLEPASMDEPRARYDSKHLEAAWLKASELIKDPCFGLRIADFWSPTDLHALGYAFLASSTLRTGFKRIARYAYVVDNSIGFSLQDDGDYVCLISNMSRQFPTVAEEDAIWSHIISLCRAVDSEELKPTEVQLRHQKLSCDEEYNKYFRCPIRFEAGRSAVIFKKLDVDDPLPAKNRELALVNDKILSRYLSSLRESDYVKRVKKAIADDLPTGTPRREKIADALYLSVRSLHRKLAAQDTTYSRLLDGVRRELAEQYILDPTRSLNEIVFLLGFSEASAFTRAFKRWTGQTPKAYRETMIA